MNASKYEPNAIREAQRARPGPRSLRRGRQESSARTASSMCPRHGESTSREAAGSDRRGEPTARPADEETGAAGRSDQAPRARQRDTAIETVAQSNASTRNTWPREEREEPRLQRRQARTAAEKAISIGSNTQRQGADPRSSTSGQRRSDSATHRGTTTGRRRTTRWTAEPVTQDEPENAIQREPPATPPRAP